MEHINDQNQEERLDRISRFEQMLDRLNESNRMMEDALERFAAAEADAQALAGDYEGPDWREDFETDEAGALPGDLKRGVLSEDGAYNALQDREELRKKLRGGD